jgi:hypothetical protein
VSIQCTPKLSEPHIFLVLHKSAIDWYCRKKCIVWVVFILKKSWQGVLRNILTIFPVNWLFWY